MDLIKLTRDLSAKLDGLRRPAGVSHVYNPLAYMRGAHERWLERFCRVGSPNGWHATSEEAQTIGPNAREPYFVEPRRVLILGMNPGPHGMVQTGVPFGDVVNARAILGAGDCSEPWCLPDATALPLAERHPDRGVVGLGCTRREPSGERLWGGLAAVWGGLDEVLFDCFAANYCPLAYFAADRTGTNVTPEEICRRSGPYRDPEYAVALDAVCTPYLSSIVRAMGIQTILAVGRYAERKANVLATLEPVGSRPKVVYLVHPSPRATSSAAEWAGMARTAMTEAGVLPAREDGAP